MAIGGAELTESPEGFSGELVRPGDSLYDEVRRIHNGMIDKRPALIARCRGVADVVAAVVLAREASLPLSVRGGGHNVAGACLVDDGVVVDLSLLKGIHVDAAARTARAQPGVTWGELNRETQLHGLAVTGGMVSTTGIAGLTLGGGLGWLMSSCGLATDNLISAQVVTAAGDVITASEDEYADLFWGLRGGGTLGVVTSFEYRLHPVGPTVTGGLIVHPFDDARMLLELYRELSVGLPDELVLLGALVHAPDGSGAKLAAVVVCHSGSQGQAEVDLAPLLEFGSPLDVQVGPMPYSAVNTLLDAAYPRGALNYWKSSFMSDLSAEAIDVAVSQFADAPSPMTAIAIEYFHGEATRVPVEATAVPHREPGFNFLITSVWTDPEATDANVAWTRDAFAAMAPFLVDRRYVNYFSEDDAGGHSTHGPNVERLARIRQEYDPGGLFGPR